MLIGQNTNNYIINGRMDFWQRNTTFATPASGSYTADRFRVSYDGTIGTFSVSRQAFVLGQTDVPNDPQFFYRWDQTVAGSGSTFRRVEQRVEFVRTLNGKKATVSVYMKADAARTVSVDLVQNFGTGGSPSAQVDLPAQTINLTTSWQRFNITFDIPTIVGKTLGTDNNAYLSVIFDLPVNTLMTIDMANLMLVEGEAPADFELAGGSLAGELALCQRYYEQLSSLPVRLTMAASDTMRVSESFKTEKRRLPTVTPNVSALNNATIAINNVSTRAFTVAITSTGGGGSGGTIDPNFDAEL